MNICSVFDVEVNFMCSVLFVGFKFERCPEQLRSLKESASKPGVFITCTVVTGMMLLKLYHGGEERKTKSLVFICFCMMFCLLKIQKERLFSVYDGVLRLGGSAVTAAC